MLINKSHFTQQVEQCLKIANGYKNTVFFGKFYGLLPNRLNNGSFSIVQNSSFRAVLEFHFHSM